MDRTAALHPPTTSAHVKSQSVIVSGGDMTEVERRSKSSEDDQSEPDGDDSSAELSESDCEHGHGSDVEPQPGSGSHELISVSRDKKPEDRMLWERLEQAEKDLSEATDTIESLQDTIKSLCSHLEAHIKLFEHILTVAEK